MQNSPGIFLFVILIMELSSLGQKTVKFTIFWVEFCEFHLILAFSPPLVMNNFYCVEIHSFHLKIDLKRKQLIPVCMLFWHEREHHMGDYLTRV